MRLKRLVELRENKIRFSSWLQHSMDLLHASLNIIDVFQHVKAHYGVKSPITKWDQALFNHTVLVSHSVKFRKFICRLNVYRIDIAAVDPGGLELLRPQNASAAREAAEIEH